MSKKNSIYVEVGVPLGDTQAAITIIDRFLKKNRLKINISIAYDFSSVEAGVYRPFEKGQEYRIFVNPSVCKTHDEIENQDGDEPYCPGSLQDMTLFGVTIHEFSHLLQYQVYPTIIKDFIKEFPTQRLYLNRYSNHEIRDELAEIQTLYITNPYLLKLISKPHFNFCKRYFKPAVACSLKRCAFIYKGFPIQVKEHLKNNWGISYNYFLEKFEINITK